jgi:hypothetical protein
MFDFTRLSLHRRLFKSSDESRTALWSAMIMPKCLVPFDADEAKMNLAASTQTAIDENRNRLVTASITTRDLENYAHASASSSGFSLSTDMFTQGKYGLAKSIFSNALGNVRDSEDASGQTRAAISDATIIITDEAEQLQRTGQTAGQAIADLNRDTATAHTAVEPIDHRKLEETVEAERIIKQEAVKIAVLFTVRTGWILDPGCDTSPNGYVTYKGPNGETVTIKPTGEVITTQKVKIDPDNMNSNAPKYSQRRYYDGTVIPGGSHSTGQFVEPWKP